MSTAIKILVQGATSAERSRLTSDLQQELSKRIDGVSFTRMKASDESQDAGAILVAALAAPAAVEFAKGPLLELSKGIADWMRRRRVNIYIANEGGVVIENVRSDAVLEALRQALEGRGK